MNKSGIYARKGQFSLPQLSKRYRSVRAFARNVNTEALILVCVTAFVLVLTVISILA